MRKQPIFCIASRNAIHSAQTTECNIIKSFQHKGLKRFFEDDDASGIQPNHRKKLRVLLTVLDNATDARQMNMPGAGLHPLQHNLTGFWSVKVSGNWRLIFTFEDGDAHLVDYLDYH